MKKLIVLSFFLLSFCSCNRTSSSNENTLVSIQIIDRNGFAETISTKDRLARYQTVDFCSPQPYQKVLRVFGKNNQGKFRSQMTSYHSNGLIRQYLEIIDGRANGLYKEWHENGKLKMELCVIEGPADFSDKSQSSWVFDGVNRIWDDQGQKVAEIYYQAGMLHGDSLYYYPDGQIKKKIPYFQDQICDAVLLYAEDGTILEHIPYEKDKIHGKAYAYDKKNNLLYTEVFSNDALEEGYYYFQNPHIDQKKTQGIKQGTGIRAEFEDGTLTKLVEYKNGYPEGLVECLNPNGSLRLSYHQKEGKKHGEEREYYPESTQVKILLNWQEDVLQGVMKTWFPGGSQESQRELYQNKKNGLLYAWYKNGDLMLVEEYEKDILISGSYYKKNDKKPVSQISKGKAVATLYNSDGYFLKKIPYEKGLPIVEADEIP
jgi:antitoxin component YwqK of YwqJK toxin-antitoxin module